MNLTRDAATPAIVGHRSTIFNWFFQDFNENFLPKGTASDYESEGEDSDVRVERDAEYLEHYIHDENGREEFKTWLFRLVIEFSFHFSFFFLKKCKFLNLIQFEMKLFVWLFVCLVIRLIWIRNKKSQKPNWNWFWKHWHMIKSILSI